MTSVRRQVWAKRKWPCCSGNLSGRSQIEAAKLHWKRRKWTGLGKRINFIRNTGAGSECFQATAGLDLKSQKPWLTCGDIKKLRPLGSLLGSGCLSGSIESGTAGNYNNNWNNKERNLENVHGGLLHAGGTVRPSE